MPNGDLNSDMSDNSGDYDTVTFPDGRTGFVPKGYGQQARAMMPQQGRGQRGGGAADMIGTFADGFEAVQQFLGSGDMQRDLDDARSVLSELDTLRDIYAAMLDSSNPAAVPNTSPYKTPGQVWKRMEQLQDKRDYLQERIISAQIKLNYGAGLAAGGRVVGQLMSGQQQGGGLFGGNGGDTDLLLGVGGLGLGYLLLRDRSGGGSSSGSNSGSSSGTARY